MKRPAFQFYPADWRKDVALRSCSMAARGLWMDLLCIAHECEPYGHLVVNGRPMAAAGIANQVGLSPSVCAKLLEELLANGVARKTPEGVIYSKRMVEDEELRNKRAEGGKAGSGHGAKGAEHGKKGGRPKKERGDESPSENPPPDESRGVLEPPLEPPPSSSSSSSSSSSLRSEYDDSASVRADDAETPSTWEAWRRWFEAEEGIEADPHSLHDRAKFRPLAQGWVNARVTAGLMRRAIAKAKAEATEPIAYLPAYVDRVLANLAAPAKARGAPGKGSHTGFETKDYREGVNADGSLA